MSSTKGNKRKRVILTIEHKLEICRNLKIAQTFTKAIKHFKFFTKTNRNKMIFSTQIMFKPLRCSLNDVLLLFKIQDSVFFKPTCLFGIFTYPNGFQIYLGGGVRISGSLQYFNFGFNFRKSVLKR